MEWEAEAETQELATNTPQTYNNQYAALADKEEKEDNNNEITGVDNDGESQECDTTTKSQKWTATMRAQNQEAQEKMTNLDKLALIEEAIGEAERDIAEATDLLAGTETKNEEARNENVIHSALQVPTVEHTYNLQQITHPRPDYTNRYGLQATSLSR